VDSALQAPKDWLIPSATGAYGGGAKAQDLARRIRHYPTPVVREITLLRRRNVALTEVTLSDLDAGRDAGRGMLGSSQSHRLHGAPPR